jgi:amidase
MRRSIGGIIPPSLDELKRIANTYGFELSDEEARFHYGLIEGTLASYRRVGELPEPKPEVKYPRTPGRAPEPAENALGAWAWRCSVKGAPSGKLAGKTVALKDPIAVAGVPTRAGSAIMQGFVPDIDATVVARILEAGGEIVGKAVCEDMCISGGSITSCPGPVKNPHNPEYSAGGSSSGSAALVAAGLVDLTLGADQGGSIRIPAALSGVVGLKPTYGLVPYTGIFPIENTLDHVGPICRTTKDVALLLEVIAGRDPLDPRQRFDTPEVAYTAALTGDIKGLTVGVVREGFGWEEGSKETDDAVRHAAAQFERLGARVREISVPMHRDGVHIYTPVLLDGAAMQMVRGNGFGYGWKGYYPTSAIEFYARSRKANADVYSDLVKLLTLCGHYMAEKYNGHYYARAQNQMRTLQAAYDAALREFDVLVMPTTAPEGKAMKMTPNPSPEQYIAETFRYHFNCCPFDGTGHPSLSVPCAKVSGLPVGMMIIGRHFDDATVLRAAHAFETLGLF